MPELTVSIDRLKSLGDEFSNIASVLDGSASDINSIKSSLGFEIKNREQIVAALSGISKSLENYSTSSGKIKSAVEEIASAYQRTESKLAGKDVGEMGGSRGDSSSSKSEGDAWWEKIGKWFGNVKKATVDCVNYVVDDFKNKGWTYTAFRFGKAVAKIAGGAGALAVVLGTGGVLAPIAGAYAVNSIFNGFADMYTVIDRTSKGQNADFEESNLLKDIVVTSGKGWGKLFGNEELGGEIGETLYDTGNILSSVYTLGNAYDMAKLKNLNFGKAVHESKGALSGLGHLATKTDLSNLKVQFSIFKQTYPNAVYAVSTIKSFTGGLGEITSNIIQGKGFFGGVIGDITEFGYNLTH